MDLNILKKLEFYKIIEIVSNFCVTNQGKEIASQLAPSHQITEVKQLLQETRRSC